LKIAFVGDSFCAHHGPGTPVGEDFELGLELSKKYGLDIGQNNVIPDDFDQYDWPDLVARHFNAEPTYCGFMGWSFIQTFNHYMNITKDEDIIVFCVTEPSRTTNKHHLPLNLHFETIVQTDTPKGKWQLEYTARGPDKVKHKGLTQEKIKEIAKVSMYYRDNILDNDCNAAMHMCCIDYVDQMMVEKNKKCIWFNSFTELKHPWIKPFKPRSGPLAIEPLARFSEDLGKKWTNIRNHYTKENNIGLSNLVIDMIKNDKFKDIGSFELKDFLHIDDNVKNMDEFYGHDNAFIYP